MLTKVHIQNYKCLADTEVSLGPLNVLIGPNDSGKTSFLEALQLPGASQFSDLNSLVWQKKTDRNIAVEVSGPAQNPFQYKLVIPPATGSVLESLRVGDQGTLLMEVQQGPHGRMIKMRGNAQQLQPGARGLFHAVQMERNENPSSGPIRHVLEALRSSKTFQLNPQAMRAPVQATASPSLAENGSNLAAVLQEMLSGPDRQAILDLEAKLHEAIPTIKGVSTPLVAPNAMHQIAFTLNVDSKPPITIPCSLASDGAMLLTGFLVLVYGNTPKRLLIEEPENGLHPSRLKMVIDILRKISTGEIGNEPRQVIVTTHSPLLLNFVQPEEVRVFRRDENEGTKVVSMDKIPNIAKLRKDFAPGELWYLFGEEELVKGKAS